MLRTAYVAVQLLSRWKLFGPSQEQAEKMEKSLQTALVRSRRRLSCEGLLQCLGLLVCLLRPVSPSGWHVAPGLLKHIG